MTQELERGDSGVRSFVSVQSGLCMYPIYAFGSEEQKQKYLPEDGAGRNPRLLRSDRARRRLEPRRHAHARQERWQRVRPERREDVDHLRARSPTSPSSGRRSTDEDDQIRGFIVETDRPGFKAADVHGKWSLRASVTSSLSLQDVRIPAENLLP